MKNVKLDRSQDDRTSEKMVNLVSVSLSSQVKNEMSSASEWPLKLRKVVFETALATVVPRISATASTMLLEKVASACRRIVRKSRVLNGTLVSEQRTS